MAAVLISRDELEYERQFHRDVIRKAQEWRQEWIDRERDRLMRNPFDLLCDMTNSNTLLRALIDAHGNGAVTNLRDSVTNFHDELFQYATAVAEHKFFQDMPGRPFEYGRNHG